MSLLELLQNKKKTLKKAETVVTREDGRRFIENGDSRKLLAEVTHGFVVDMKPDNKPAKITEHIYLGSQDCCTIDVLKEYDIKYVLSVGVESPCKFADVCYYFVPCLDLPTTDLKVILLNECIPFIKTSVSNNCNILIHCNAGVSRSSAVVIGFLIIVHNYSYSEAFYKVKCVRNCIKLNEGFERQLKLLSSL